MFESSKAGSTDSLETEAYRISAGKILDPLFVIKEKNAPDFEFYYFMEGLSREFFEYYIPGEEKNIRDNSSYFDIKGVFSFNLSEKMRAELSGGYS
ncbi:MAG TPA: hypothetical protein ENN55_04585, partial [Firmicutes bacterium]|nr:hypothetical protein [Bacillota bacterium]